MQRSTRIDRKRTADARKKVVVAISEIEGAAIVDVDGTGISKWMVTRVIHGLSDIHGSIEGSAACQCDRAATVEVNRPRTRSQVTESLVGRT